MTEHRHDAPTGAEPIDHEINSRAIFQSAIWLAVVTVVSFAIAWAFYLGLAKAEKARDPKPSPILEASQPRVPPGPLLQPAPERELAALRKIERERLEGWGWSDRGRGLAQVPVERAIEAVATSGRLPEFAPAAPAAEAEAP